MQELADTELLRQYAEQDSEAAFATLVARHVNLVHSAAIRRTGNPHAAEEITQAVFIILAKKAKNLRKETALSGWLYQTTRLTAANFLRGEIRRSHREQEAYMQSLSNETEVWPQIGPLLEDAMGRLNEKERNAIVLRFFDGKSFQEIGTTFGSSENAAKKRVIHGLEKLRKFFAKNGVSSTTAIIAGAISANSVQAAPVGLAKTISAMAIAKGAAVSTSTLTLIKGALKIMAWTKAKTAAVIGVVVILAVGTTTIIVKHQNDERLPKSQSVSADETEFPKNSWHFAGYANPESALMSCMWAVDNGDSKALLASVSPSEQERLRRGKEIITAEDKVEYAKMTGYHIVSKQIVSENKIILTIRTAGQEQTAKFFVEQINGEWKLAGNANK